MSKKLFTVEVSVEIVVVAEDADDARLSALESLRDVDSDQYQAHAAPMRHYPSTWDTKSIPYGDGDKEDMDRTVEKWIELGAAPEYKTST